MKRNLVIALLILILFGSDVKAIISASDLSDEEINSLEITLANYMTNSTYTYNSFATYIQERLPNNSEVVVGAVKGGSYRIFFLAPNSDPAFVSSEGDYTPNTPGVYRMDYSYELINGKQGTTTLEITVKEAYDYEIRCGEDIQVGNSFFYFQANYNERTECELTLSNFDPFLWNLKMQLGEVDTTKSFDPLVVIDKRFRRSQIIKDSSVLKIPFFIRPTKITKGIYFTGDEENDLTVSFHKFVTTFTNKRGESAYPEGDSFYGTPGASRKMRVRFPFTFNLNLD